MQKCSLNSCAKYRLLVPTWSVNTVCVYAILKSTLAICDCCCVCVSVSSIYDDDDDRERA